MWVIITRLSNLLATMEANLCSPASSDIKKTYSGAVTWFDLWVLPVNKQQVCDVSAAIGLQLESFWLRIILVSYQLTELLYGSVSTPRQL